MTAVTGKQILQAVKDGGGFDPSMPTAARQVMEQFLLNDVPTALNSLLNEPATAELITKAQYLYNKCYLDCGMPKKMITAAIPNDPRAAQVIAVLEGKLSQAVSMLQMVASDFDSVLRQSGMRERDYLLTLNLPAGMTQKILNRQITIFEVMVDHPMAILGFAK